MTAEGECAWRPAENFDDFSVICCGQAHQHLLTDPAEFSVMQRVARIGPVTVHEFVVGSDMTMDCGEMCNAYRVQMLREGRIESVYRGAPLRAGPGAAAVYSPHGLSAARWAAGTEIACLKITRGALDDALSEAIGRQLTSQIDFTPVLPRNTAATRSWIDMLVYFKEQLFRPGSLLSQPLVAAPFVDSLVRGFLLAADHPYRAALLADEPLAAPRPIRAAIDLIEAEAHLPLTLSEIAARSHTSVRSLQQGFQRHLGTSPMTYLREVRLRRAHQALLESDPSTVTVAAVAYRWGFSNLGRFAAAHAARYREPPVKTLRRSA